MASDPRTLYKNADPTGEAARAQRVAEQYGFPYVDLEHFQIDHELLIAREERAADRDALGAGRSLDLAANRRDRLGELHGVARARSLLQQSRQKTRNSRATGGVADSAAAQHCTECDQRHIVPLRQQYDGAIG